MSSIQTLWIETTFANGTTKRDAWLPKFGKPSAKKVRELVAGARIQATMVKVIEDDSRSEPVAKVIVNF